MEKGRGILIVVWWWVTGGYVSNGLVKNGWNQKFIVERIALHLKVVLLHFWKRDSALNGKDMAVGMYVINLKIWYKRLLYLKII